MDRVTNISYKTISESRPGFGGSMLITSNTYNTAGQLVYTSSSSFIPQFDDDGNQTLIKTATGVWQVQYNGENRPIHWSCVQSNNSNNTNNQTILSMSYDQMGRRVTKSTQRFVYDGYLHIANFEHSTSNIELQTFIWDPTEPVATRPHGWNCGASAVYYTHDGNKSVSEVVATGSEISAHYEYAPFGGVIARFGASSAANSWRFSSEYMEEDTMMVYYNYRYYEPTNGRWLRRDPIGEDGFMSLYLGLENSPVNRIDSLGLKTNDQLEKECDTIRLRIWDTQKAWFNKNKPIGCPVPTVKCGCCPQEVGYSRNGRTIPNGTGKGTMSPVSTIILCFNSKANQSDDDYRRTLRHELIHAMDYCSFKTAKFTCDEEMCSEIHAYSRVNCNTLTGSEKIECVKRGAKASASRYKECKGGLVDVSAEIDKKVDKGECM